jgi:hypothetical protein
MTLLRLATMLIIISFSGPVVWAFVANLRLFDADFIVSATAFTIGVVTFFGVTELNRSSEDRRVFREENLRTAIASSLVLSYLFIVCFTAFVRSSPEVGGVTKEFVQSFSQVISVTVAFYFGASAATQIFGKRKENEQDTRRDEHK